MLAIGTTPTALWVALPIAVLVASYAPGTAPFAVGQAAFTVTVIVLFNLLVPAGWKVGLVRIQDVAIGCAVSLVVGALFWPRGAGAVVGDDLADAFRRGAAYLTQAVDWALGLRPQAPDTAPAGPADPVKAALTRQAADLADFYERVAVEVGPPRRDRPPLVDPPELDGVDQPGTAENGHAAQASLHPRAVWVREHLRHLGAHAQAITAPAERVAEQRRVPWWR
jgi:hypothetical protein